MAKIKVNQDRVTKDIAKQLEELCPFGAIRKRTVYYLYHPDAECAAYV